MGQRLAFSARYVPYDEAYVRRTVFHILYVLRYNVIRMKGYPFQLFFELLERSFARVGRQLEWKVRSSFG